MELAGINNSKESINKGTPNLSVQGKKLLFKSKQSHL